jgi:ABC-type multidrug transport system ATPase subunit
MTITLEGVGKRFHREWVIRHLSKKFISPGRYAIAGPNGSGKSTLMRMIAGQLMPSEGKVLFHDGEVPIPPDRIYRYLSWAAPYMDLIDEFSLIELLRFHNRFRPLNRTESAVLAATGLEGQGQKSLSEFSSGMKQRVKLALALYSASRLVLLDEPTTNLDEDGMAWFRTELADQGKDRLVVIASNEEGDLDGCSERLELSLRHRP